MRNDPRLIGFTAHRGCGPLSKPTHATFSIRRSLDPIKTELILPHATPLQSSFARAPRRSPCDARLHLPLGFVPSSRHHSNAATFVRGASHAPLRSVRRFSQPLDGFFRSRACRLIPSCSHVQGHLSFRGFSPEAADLPHQKIRFLLAVVSSPLVSALRLSPAHLYVHERCLSASRPCSAPGRVPQVRLFTSPKAAPLFEFHAPPGPCSLDAGLRSHGCRPLLMLRVRSSRPRRSFDDHGPAHLRGVTFHVRPGKQRGDPRAVLQAMLALSIELRFGTLVSIHRVAPYGAFASCSQLTRSRPWPSSLAFAGPILLSEDRAQSHSSSPFGESSSQSRISIDSRSFSRSSCGVTDRCIPCGTLPHRSAVFRVPRILPDTRAARLRVRLTAYTAGRGSSTPRFSSAVRPCSPFGDHDRSGSITRSVVEVAHELSLLTFRCRKSALRSLPLRRSSFVFVLAHLAMIEPAHDDAHLSAIAPASLPLILR